MGMENFWKIVEDIVNRSDYVIEVIDARMIELTRNKRLEKMVERTGKKLIIVANKSEFVSEEIIKKYRKKFKDIPFFFVSTKERKGIFRFKKKLFEMIEKKTTSFMIDIGVVGYPNTGKSSLINALCGKRKLRIGSKPGRTVGYQWIRLGNNIRFIDSPGVIPVSDEDEVNQLLMNVLDPANADNIEDAAKEIVRMFLKNNRKALEKLYNIDTSGKGFIKIVKEIGKVKKMLAKGGIIDERRVYLKIIDDWQKGKLLMKN